MVFIVNIIVELLLALILLWSKGGIGHAGSLLMDPIDSERRKKAYCTVCCILWIFVSGMRGLSVGADTYDYYRSFEQVKSYSFSFYINSFLNNITGSSYVGRDPGYDLFVKIVQIIIKDYRVYLFFLAAIVMVPFAKLVYKYSENPCTSFILYSALFYGVFSITGIRQTIAFSLVVLTGDKYIRERKILPFVILTIVAATFHKTALVVFPFYFISQLRVCKRNNIIWSLLIIVSFIFRSQLRTLYLHIVPTYAGYASNNKGNAPVFTALMIAVLIVTLLTSNNDHERDENKIYYNALFMAVFFCPLVLLNPSAIRLVYYFAIYMVFVLPMDVNRLTTRKSRLLAFAIIDVILILLLIRGNPQYYFFWNDPLVTRW